MGKKCTAKSSTSSSSGNFYAAYHPADISRIPNPASIIKECFTKVMKMMTNSNWRTNNNKSLVCLLVLVFLISTFQSSHSQEMIAKSCSCLKYWQCVNAGGIPYSYCGINQICCMDPSSVSSSSPSSSTSASFSLPSFELIDTSINPNEADSVMFATSFSDRSSAGSSSNNNNPESTSTSSASASAQKSKITTCGVKGFDSGREGISDPGEWSWHTAILEKNQDLYVCGASLLDEYWVLTAAHCVDDYQDAKKLKIRVGEHDVSSLKEPLRHDEYNVDRIFVHPQFNNNTLLNDIALLRLTEAVKKRSNIGIICLPDEDTFKTSSELMKSKCIITGWGRRSENSSESEHSLVLKEIPIPIWDQVRCQSMLRRQFGREYKLPEKNLCAGSEGRDACDGDGGGPLVCQHKLNQNWYQMGIVSFGIGCGRKNVPGVYTRVSSFVPWIYATAAANPPILRSS